MSRRRSDRALIVLTAVFGFVMTACGGGPSTKSAPEPVAPAARPDLTRFLIRANEEPGWAPIGKPETISTVSAFVEDEEDIAAAEKRLREEGFEVFVVQHLEDKTGHFGGVTNVSLFTTAEGANRELRHRTGTVEQDFAGATIERFTVPGVPSAQGFTASNPGGQIVSEVRWSQGRCQLTLGNEFDGPLVEQVRTGVRAIYERTDGRCP